MCTTLTIDNDLLKQLKASAARQKKTLAVVVNELLHQALAHQGRRPPYKLNLEGWEAEPQSGVDRQNRNKLFDLMNSR